MAKGCVLVVIAPVPMVDYAARMSRWLAGFGVPRYEADAGFEVWHPRWLFPPNGGAVTAACLAARLLLRIRPSVKADLLDAHFAFPEGVAAAVLARVIRRPYMVTLRGNEPIHAQYRSRRLLMKWALRNAARVITVSDRLRTFAISLGVQPERAVTIPNGIDPAVFYPRDRMASRAKHGLPCGAKLVLSVASVIPLKGHHHVVRAIAALRAQEKAAHLVIVGSEAKAGSYSAELRRLILTTGMGEAVTLFGPTDPNTVAELMSAADVFCLASTREGWPNVLHESLACGTPVVATDVGAVPDLIPSPQYGRIVPVADEQMLTQALGEALETEWERQAITDWAHARTWERVASEVLTQAQTVVSYRRERS